jgi:predicted nuclease of predicted toxin-antitoxin system
MSRTASDLEILEFARQENRVIVTQDLDFSMLLALGGYNKPSLITLRLSLTDPNIVTQKLIDTIPQVEQILIEGGAVTIEDASVRSRRLPMR